MKRSTYIVTAYPSEGYTPTQFTKYSWNSAVSIGIGYLRTLGGVWYETNRSFVKDNRRHVGGSMTWERVDGFKVHFSITKIAE